MRKPICSQSAIFELRALTLLLRLHRPWRSRWPTRPCSVSGRPQECQAVSGFTADVATHHIFAAPSDDSKLSLLSIMKFSGPSIDLSHRPMPDSTRQIVVPEPPDARRPNSTSRVSGYTRTIPIEEVGYPARGNTTGRPKFRFEHLLGGGGGPRASKAH